MKNNRLHYLRQRIQMGAPADGGWRDLFCGTLIAFGDDLRAYSKQSKINMKDLYDLRGYALMCDFKKLNS